MKQIAITKTMVGTFLMPAFFVLLTLGFLLPHQVLATTQRGEIQAAFREMLDRDPTQVDYNFNLAHFTSRLAIEAELNQWPERRWVIEKIYQQALGRMPMEREVIYLKSILAPVNLIRAQLYSAKERTLAINNVYSRYLDRMPDTNSMEFYKKTRSDIGKILAVINGGKERKLVMKKIVANELGRDPTDEEIAEFLKVKADRVGIARGLRNPLIVKVTDSLGNVQENSWAVEQTGGWSMDEYASGNYPVIKVGDKITFTIYAFDYLSSVEQSDTEVNSSCATNSAKPINKIYYKFTVGNKAKLIQDWSTENSVTWTVDTANLGHGVPITAWVKDNNVIERMGPGLGDDYTYLTYNIQSVSSNGDATLTSVDDSLGNSQTNSWIPDGSFGWSIKPQVSVGQIITLTATASDPENDALEYRFIFCGASNTCTTKREWYTGNTYSWQVTSADVGASVSWGIEVRDSNDIYAAGDNGDDWTMISYQVNGGSNKNATFIKVTDNLGHVKKLSFVNGAIETDDFSTLPYPAIKVGQSITFAAEATDPEGDPLEYKFLTTKTGGSVVIGQDWSSNNTFTWTPTDDYVSPNTAVYVNVRDNNGENWVGDNGDDWTALTYQVWE